MIGPTPVLALSVLLVMGMAQQLGPDGRARFQTWKATLEADAWLEGQTNQGSAQLLIVGKHTGYPVKRSAVRGPTPRLGCVLEMPTCTLNMFFAYAHRASSSRFTWLDWLPLQMLFAVCLLCDAAVTASDGNGLLIDVFAVPAARVIPSPSRSSHPFMSPPPPFTWLLFLSTYTLSLNS